MDRQVVVRGASTSQKHQRIPFDAVVPYGETLEEEDSPEICPYCGQWYRGGRRGFARREFPGPPEFGSSRAGPEFSGRRALQMPAAQVKHHFQLLMGDTGPFKLNTGYYKKFFREVGVVGRGGSGSVHLVEHWLDEQPLGEYACKRVPVGASHMRLERVLREVQVLVTVRHANIVTYYHTWLEESQQSAFTPRIPTLFILMEYVRGGSLEAYVERRRKEGGMLRAPEIAHYVRGIAQGLGYLHGRGILHLDLKGDNVLLQVDHEHGYPTVKLTDFGSSDAAETSHVRTGATGTTAWLPPEAFSQPHRASAADDMWACGLLVYLMVHMELPWPDDTEGDMLAAHICRFCVPEKSPTENALFHMLMVRLLSRDPAERMSCAGILALMHEMHDWGKPAAPALHWHRTWVSWCMRGLPAAHMALLYVMAQGLVTGGIVPGGIATGGIVPGGIVPEGLAVWVGMCVALVDARVEDPALRLVLLAVNLVLVGFL